MSHPVASRSTRMVIFAKAPQPGRVKTRLIPAIGAEGSAYLARQMLDHTLKCAAAAQASGHVAEVELCMDPPPHDSAWQGIPIPDAVHRTDQGAGDLGERMARAVLRVTQTGYQNAVLIGTDCPSLTANRLAEAVAHLEQHQAVMLPAHDGGYVLLGLQAHCPEIFTSMAWSSPAVAAETTQRLAAQRVTLWQGAPLHDIDEPADLAHLPSGFETIPPGLAPAWSPALVPVPSATPTSSTATQS